MEQERKGRREKNKKAIFRSKRLERKGDVKRNGEDDDEKMRGRGKEKGKVMKCGDEEVG